LKQRRITLFLILAAMLVLFPPSGEAQYSVIKGDEPRIRAILYHSDNPRALLYYKNQRHHVVGKMRIDDEWLIEEIRRESILFKKSSTKTFAEIYLNAPKRARNHRDWSFFGHPVALWEAIELLAHGFGYHALMHFQAGGPVVPGNHADSLKNMLRKVLPPHHRFAIVGPLLMVLPVQPSGEEWTEVLARINKASPGLLTMRYPGLNKPGVIISRGDDIQFILRKISLGGKVPIQFPRDLHFPVYATFRNVPFAQILANTVYLNQCIIIEREEGLEITPWPRQILQRRPYADYPLLQALPSEPQDGSGPTPPPIVPEHLLDHPVVHQNTGNMGDYP